MARPSKLTPEVQAKLVEVIAGGGYYDVACQEAGIEYRTFRNWMVRGKKEEGGEYFQFFHAIKKAEAEHETKCLKRWDAQMDTNWQAIATFLERRHPERWSKDRLELKKIVKELQDTRKEIAEIKASIK